MSETLTEPVQDLIFETVGGHREFTDQDGNRFAEANGQFINLEG